MLRLGRKRKRKPRKGFSRSKKEWEETIASHIGKAIDRFTIDDFLTIGVGIWGGLHMEDPLAGLVAAIGYRLASRPIGGTPPVAQIAGVSMLAAIGIGGLPMMGEERGRLEPTDKPDIDCGPNCDLRWSIIGGWRCVPLFPGAQCTT